MEVVRRAILWGGGGWNVGVSVPSRGTAGAKVKGTEKMESL